jgi:hypothetical protein
MFAAILPAFLLAAQPISVVESCRLVHQGPPGEWRFVKVYDAASGEEFMSSVIKVGEPKVLYDAPARIRITYKYAGARQYRSGPTAECSKGNTVTF